MTYEPAWLSIETVTAIHAAQIAEHGGVAGIRDATLLESALHRPRQTFLYADPAPSIARLAAAYGFGLARNHPFADGNKRSATIASLTFLRANQYDVAASQDEIYDLFEGLARRAVDEDGLIAWLEQRARRRVVGQR